MKARELLVGAVGNYEKTSGGGQRLDVEVQRASQTMVAVLGFFVVPEWCVPQ